MAAQERPGEEMTFILANWKLVLIGLLVLAITGLFAAYQWQRSSLVASKATIEAQRIEIAGRDAQIEAQKKNLEAIKKHQARVQTITKEVQVIKEVIREVPVVSFGGNCEGENADAEKIKVAAANIATLFNGSSLRSEDSNGGGGEVLPETDKAGADGPAEPK